MWWNFESLFGPPYLKLLATTHMFLSSLHNPHIALQPASLLSDFSSFLKQLISGWLQYVRRPSADQRFLRWQLKDVNFLIFVSGRFVNVGLSSSLASTFLTTTADDNAPGVLARLRTNESLGPNETEPEQPIK